MRRVRQSVAVLMSWYLVFTTTGDLSAFQAPEPTQTPQPAPAPQPGQQPEAQALQQSPEELQQLVAPIALYPDTLVAQILAASTYPAEIVEAQKWMEDHKKLEGEKLAKEVNKQKWDPSVKAMTQFPAVLANMNQNLAWTSELGDAYINQGQALNQAIQTMRQKAQQAGNLKTTPQENVSTQGNTIVIQPTSPEVVYVPQYDPWLVYGAPIPVWPGWYGWPGLYLGGLGIGFGLGFGVGLFAGFGWGWGHWGYDWHGPGRVVFNHNTFISRSTTIVNRGGFNRGGFRGGAGFRGGGDFHGGGFAGRNDRGFGGHEGFQGGTHSGAFSGFDHGGFARGDSFRGGGSFGGFHGGGFGGFHGGGGGRR